MSLWQGIKMPLRVVNFVSFFQLSPLCKFSSTVQVQILPCGLYVHLMFPENVVDIQGR